MMTKYIYLGGGMSGLSPDEQLSWRVKFQHLVDGFDEMHICRELSGTDRANQFK